MLIDIASEDKSMRTIRVAEGAEETFEKHGYDKNSLPRLWFFL